MMKRILTITTCVGTLLAAASTAHAQERWPLWYVGLTGSAVFSDEADVSVAGTNGDLDLDAGWGAGVSLGYMPNFKHPFFAPLRFEGEIFYRENGADSGTLAGVTTTENGDVSTTSYMVNAIWDIKTGTRITPYIGGGIGMANVDVPNTTTFGNADDDDTVFAWQLLTGLQYEPVSIPHTVWSLGYRYHVLDDVEFSQGGVNTTVELDGSHNLEAGVKLRF